MPHSFSHVAMSGDGKLLAAVSGPSVYLLDAFNGSLKATFNSGLPPGAPGFEPSFSPDSQYLSSGETLALRPMIALSSGLPPGTPDFEPSFSPGSQYLAYGAAGLTICG